MIALMPKFNRYGTGGYIICLDRFGENFIDRLRLFNRKIYYKGDTVQQRKIFVLTWKNGKIAIKDGMADKVLMEWTDPDPIPVNTIGIST